MKLIKLIFISACLLTSIHMMGQETDTTEAHYTYELIPSGITAGDTLELNQVIVIMDSTDVNRYISISVESSGKLKELSVTKEVRKDNPRIKVKNKTCLMDMLEWSANEELIVMAIKPDGTKVKLKKHPRGSEFTHKVVTLRTKTRDLKIYDGPGRVEEENVDEQ